MHKRHPTAKNPTLDQRIAWHLERQKQCACRPIPARLPGCDEEGVGGCAAETKDDEPSAEGAKMKAAPTLPGDGARLDPMARGAETSRRCT